MIACEAMRTIADLTAGGTSYTGIAHQNIQDKRASTLVPCGPGGSLHNYVPFYFCVRSPMLFAIYRGIVDGYEQGQQAVIYLMSTVQDVISDQLEYVFTDGHGIMKFTKIYDDPAYFCEIDWPLMNARYWRDTIDDPDRKRRRQAEFLVQGGFPWRLVGAIVVMDDATRDQVQTLLQQSAHKPPVIVNRTWYY